MHPATKRANASAIILSIPTALQKYYTLTAIKKILIKPVKIWPTVWIIVPLKIKDAFSIRLHIQSFVIECLYKALRL